MGSEAVARTKAIREQSYVNVMCRGEAHLDSTGADDRGQIRGAKPSRSCAGWA